MDVVVIGNTTLDVLCYPVNDVPRDDSLSFDQAMLAPGGCGCNVAIGLASLGVSAGLVTVISDDPAYQVVEAYWQRAGVDQRFVRRVTGRGPAVSICLVDHEYQPRFIHTPGPNRLLTSPDLDIDLYVQAGARALMVAGFYVLPGLLDGGLPAFLQAARARGILTFLDVANTPRMDQVPQAFWDCLPHLDYCLCNTREARRLTGLENPSEITCAFRAHGAGAAIVKLGAEGCWADSAAFTGRLPGKTVPVVDTTGAGDAFAAGLIAACLRDEALPAACAAANEAGARIVTALGAVTAWF